MAQKQNSPIVYSTNPDFKFNDNPESREETLLPKAQKLKILLDKKHRGGKAVTLITGFTGSEADLENLGKKLKSFCGSGGSVKNGEIIVQGDHREKVFIWLKKNDYNLSKMV